MVVVDERLLDDGQEIKVPVLFNGAESVMEFIDLPYSGVSTVRHLVYCKSLFTIH